MKKSKLLVIGLLALSLTSVNSYSGLFGGSSGLGKIVGILKEMRDTQAGIKLTELEVLAREIQQVENQVKQLENEARNLKGLGESLKVKGIKDVIDMINKVENTKNITLGELRRRQAELENISKYFSLNQKEFEKEGEWTKLEIKQTQERLEKMRDDVKVAAAKINQKSKNGYSLRTEDLEKLKDKVKTLNDADGEVAAIQALGGLTSQTNEILTDLKEILLDQNNLIANLEQSTATEKDAREQAKKDEEKTNEKIGKKWKEQAEQAGKKKIKLNFKVN